MAGDGFEVVPVVGVVGVVVPGRVTVEPAAVPVVVPVPVELDPVPTF
jgi:hypothetical protein